MEKDEFTLSLKWYDDNGKLPVSDDPQEIIIDLNKKNDKYILSIEREVIETFDLKKDVDRYLIELKNELKKIEDNYFEIECELYQHLKLFKELKSRPILDVEVYQKRLINEFKNIGMIIRKRI